VHNTIIHEPILAYFVHCP